MNLSFATVRSQIKSTEKIELVYYHEIWNLIISQEKKNNLQNSRLQTLDYAYLCSLPVEVQIGVEEQTDTMDQCAPDRNGLRL